MPTLTSEDIMDFLVVTVMMTLGLVVLAAGLFSLWTYLDLPTDWL